MKKTFKSYIGVWVICLLTFNLIAFVVPNEMKANFWVGYSFITLAFLGQLFCANLAFKSQNAQKFFYKFPLISISFIGTIAMLVVGSLTMTIAAIPVWAGIVFCTVILSFSAISIINASVASDVVGNVDEKIKVNTLFIKLLTVDANTLRQKAASNQAKEITQKVYETVRYSDPMSCEELNSIEAQITIAFKEFENAVCNNLDVTTSLGEKIIILINERNDKCKFIK